MNNDFVDKAIKQATEIGKEIGERARESAAVTGNQAADVAAKAAPHVRGFLDKAYKAASDAISKIDKK